MSAVDLASPRIKQNEGFRNHAYMDTRNNLTIGYGFCIDAGISERAATALLNTQIQELHEILLRYSWYSNIDEVRQGVCVEIAFNAGLHGLLGFPRMIAALSEKNWIRAKTECRVGDPELQERYEKLGTILLTGVNE